MGPVNQGMCSFTELDLCRWLGAATAGDRVCYHRGFLALDCDPAASHLGAADRRELSRVAKRALQAVEAGFVYPTQRRNGPGDFAYLLVARPRPISARVSIRILLQTVGDRPLFAGG